MKGQVIQSFLVEMLPADGGDEMSVAAVDALDEQDAREKAKAQFPDCLILHVSKFEEGKNSFLFEE